MVKYSDIQVSPRLGDAYEVLKDIQYKDIVVPQGFSTNGANIPRVFWSLLPPNRSDYLPAVIVHDYLCDLELYGKANKYFDEILKDLGVSNWVVFIMVNSVKAFHRITYPHTYTDGL